ncbi:Protein kinase [Cedratvirus Zaza IHUMI]|uniref:Protein kinase n=1 Tax=Cedratvirus Zaza IHUMI TaxID=2126979 RepID=A0A2R8FFX9_9VIRU|nr:Protein kinase [Cedratvirus Zaza IHUMI]
MELRLNWYRHLSPRLHACVEAVLKDLIREKEVIEFIEKNESHLRLNEQEHISRAELYRAAVLCAIPSTRLFEKEFLSRVCCYHYLKPDKYYLIERVVNKGQYVRIGFTKSALVDNFTKLATDNFTACTSGYTSRDALVVKWFRNQDMDITFEMGLYKKLRLLGCPLPYFSCSYRFWKDKVLLMEELESLSEEDDPYQVGVCVLEQLSYLHTFAVHSDIKPNNIMRKGKRYYLIDFGGVALKRLDYGYKRWNWSEKWTSQKMHVKNQITTAKNDLIELGYTLNYLEQRHSPLLESVHRKDPRSGFQGKLAEYMNEVRRLDAEVQPGEEVYAHLKSILTK